MNHLSKMAEYEQRISELKPSGPLQAQEEVYSLYVVGAELGVLNLLPAVGQL